MKSKAKDLKTGRWIEGFHYEMSETTYCFKEDYERFPVATLHFILQETMTDWCLPNRMVEYRVDGKTLCHYTSMDTINNIPVYEHDLFSYHFGDNIGEVKFGRYRNPFDTKETMNIGFYIDWTGDDLLRKDLGYWVGRMNLEPIGNSIDNPELLKKKEENDD